MSKEFIAFGELVRRLTEDLRKCESEKSRETMESLGRKLIAIGKALKNGQADAE